MFDDNTRQNEMHDEHDTNTRLYCTRADFVFLLSWQTNVQTKGKKDTGDNADADVPVDR